MTKRVAINHWCNTNVLKTLSYRFNGQCSINQVKSMGYPKESSKANAATGDNGTTRMVYDLRKRKHEDTLQDNQSKNN